MTTPILDGHCHAFPDALAPSAMATLLGQVRHLGIRASHDGTVAGLLASLDHAGIGRAILCSVATRPGQVRKITDWSAAIASDRIVPFASIHPDFDAVEAEAERIASLGIRGIKFHSQYMGCAIEDPRTLRIAKAAAAAGLAVAFHAGYDPAYPPDELAEPRQFRRLHEQVPALRMQVCHLGGWKRWPRVLEELAGQDVYLETSFSLGPDCPDDLRAEILARHPKERLMFGTDSPWADQSEQLAAFRRLPIDEEAMRLALWENGHRFAGIPAHE